MYIQIKNDKEPEEDCVCSEMLKAESKEGNTSHIAELPSRYMNIPEDWKKGVIIELPKKGDPGDCNNWRGITLLSLTSKVFSPIILQRMTESVKNILRQEQAGFRKGRSCTDHIFVLRQILKRSHEWNRSIYAVFVDFEKAFDSIYRESL